MKYSLLKIGQKFGILAYQFTSKIALIFISARVDVNSGKKSHDEIGSERMGPGDSSGYGGAMQQEKALANLVSEMRDQSISATATALLDDDMKGFGVPNPRVLIVGCGGSGNNTLNRITHLGVEGAVTVAMNTDKQHLDHTRALQKLLVGRHITKGLGAGGDPSTGRRCAEAGRDMIKRIVTGADLVLSLIHI